MGEDTATHYDHVTESLRDTLHGVYRALRVGNSEDIQTLAGVLCTTVSAAEYLVRDHDRRIDFVPDHRLGYLHLCMLIGLAHRVLEKLPEKLLINPSTSSG